MPAPITIGLLVPHSQIYPLLGQNLLAGVRLALAQAGGEVAGRPVELIVEPIGLGQIQPEQRLIKLLNIDGAQLVLGLANANVATMLQRIYAPRQACFIALNLGEHMLREGEHSPFCAHVSLGMWQANVALGAWAAATIGRRALMAQSFYDSGYDLPYSFQHGFESAGGAVLHTVITHRPPDSGDFGPLVAQIRDQRPDLVFASYCGPEATAFLRAWAAAGFAGQIPLLGSGLLCADSLLPEQGEAARGVYTALADGDPQAPAGAAFAAAFADRTERAADPFALLGYEAMQLAIAGLSAVGGRPPSGEALAAAIAAARIDSPRGRLARRPGSPLLCAPSATLRQVDGPPGALTSRPLAQLPVVGEQDALMRPVFTQLRSGWLNPYLCV